ncbi:argininosuccinate synthase [Ignicoccus islandicus DSM 13165]|uniref:Argininosuccinate synthase n=1 Tax=Ignicoccus islandicus DSM 13165 TaxID=940295 RepID=A0A0U3E0A4_9CREN|nr:argininosuccinate synthase [Ignicoccus islandicus]ALU11339.1 argininosuccinate synthase [Ignicoccus islandicus DSM 13165]
MVEDISKIVLAYSGGLDTSVAIAWLKEKFGAEVVTVTVDVGQKEDFKEIEKRAYKAGASKHYLIDAKREFANDFISKAILANALYEGKYPLGTALARPLIGEKVVEIARKEGADAVAHGSTSKGNDQIRFEAVFKALAPDIKIIAPIRIWGMNRKEEVEFAKRKGIPISESSSKYSIDENLWSRSIEGGELEDPWNEPPPEAFEWVTPPEMAPSEPLELVIEFDKGLPVAVNGERMELLDLIGFLNSLVGKYGYGIIDHMENRVVGLKSREVYEAPAALSIINAKKDLEKLVLSKREYRMKKQLEDLWAEMVYEGLWYDPLRIELDEIFRKMNENVSGEVKAKIVKGSFRVVGRRSPYAIYDRALSSYESEWFPSDEMARGFIDVWLMDSIVSFQRKFGVKK